jgi:hypothetical protein
MTFSPSGRNKTNCQREYIGKDKGLSRKNLKLKNADRIDKSSLFMKTFFTGLCLRRQKSLVFCNEVGALGRSSYLVREVELFCCLGFRD